MSIAAVLTLAPLPLPGRAATARDLGLARSVRRPSPGLVVAVADASPAAAAGVAPGDRLLAINGLVPRDIIDVRIDASVEHVELDVQRGTARLMLAVDKDPDEDLGITFDSPAFDRMKTCNNACEFCFIRGLPRGLRRSLYVKDDDFRYSFLYGNFATLTNLSEAEWRRLIFQRLGPLRVSVHATDTPLRRRLLGNPRAPSILEQIEALGPHGIHIHAQIVLMPGLNDGDVLDETIVELRKRYPYVESAAVVPVGLTAHSNVTHIRPLTPADAATAIDQVEAVQRRARRELGCGFVYAADELYLLAARKLPRPQAYDDYPQLENGVGLMQLFRDGWRRAARRLPSGVDPPRRVAWATGALTAPMLRELALDLTRVEGLHVEVVEITNTLFGGEVTVAGLVPGENIAAALAGTAADRVVLPRSMFDVTGELTIDGLSPQLIADRLGIEVAVGSSPRELIRLSTETKGPIAMIYLPMRQIRHQAASAE